MDHHKPMVPLVPLTFIRTSHKRTLGSFRTPWPWLIPIWSNTKTIRAISIPQIKEELIGNKITVNHVPIILDTCRKSDTCTPKMQIGDFLNLHYFGYYFHWIHIVQLRNSNLNLCNWHKGGVKWELNLKITCHGPGVFKDPRYMTTASGKTPMHHMKFVYYLEQAWC